MPSDEEITPDWDAMRRRRRSPAIGVPVHRDPDLTPPPVSVPSDVSELRRHADKHIAMLREQSSLIRRDHDSALRRIANLELAQNEVMKTMNSLEKIATSTSVTVAHLSVQLDKLVSSQSGHTADRSAWARTFVGLVIPGLALLASILIALNR